MKAAYFMDVRRSACCQRYRLQRKGDRIVIRTFKENDLTAVMQIWLDTNIKAHHFIPKEYWTDHYETVKELLPQAEVYVYEADENHQIAGFIGLTGNYIDGIFIKEAVQSKGIGKQLLDYVKKEKGTLRLNVYQKNVRAVSFYRREGFTVQSESMEDSTKEKDFVMKWCK